MYKQKNINSVNKKINFQVYFEYILNKKIIVERSTERVKTRILFDSETDSKKVFYTKLRVAR